MKINKTNAYKLWEEQFGNENFANDFHGCLMCKEGYGNQNYYIINRGERIYCGWNIHHILPECLGGTNEKTNLLCTNFYTNEEAGDKVTYWIDTSLYQVRKEFGKSEHYIIKLN